ncbi:universal stress protein [Rhizobium sp. CRIBSB]|nr:universal stress protein [Rhizobium sp. CRIBSB]
MRYASVMVYVEDHEIGAARLDLARAIADHFDARLLGVMGSSVTPPAVDTWTGGAMLGETASLFNDIATAEVKRAEAVFRTGTAGFAHGCEWRGRTGYPGDVVGHALRAADIMVLGRRVAEGVPAGASAIDPGDILMIAGRPLLITPPNPVRSPIGEPAVVAWTDSREAQRAVFAALPMLKAASRVHVVEIAPEERLPDAGVRTADVVGFLAAHGISAEARPLRGDGRARCEQLIGFAIDVQAGLIVAGGYGHARMREWVMGGVTHGLLNASPVCLLLCH